jgi:hypothetical protein
MNNAAGRRAFKKDDLRAKRKKRIAERLKKKAGRKKAREDRRNKRKGIVDKPKPKPPKKPSPGKGQIHSNDFVRWTNADGTKGSGASTSMPEGATRDRFRPMHKKVTT